MKSININEVRLLGRLTHDVEMTKLPSGLAVGRFSVATNRDWTTAEGKRQHDAQFHKIVVFGNRAETVARYKNKGDEVYVTGRLQTRDWEDKDGQKRSTTEVVAESVEFGARSRSNKAAADTAGESDTLKSAGEVIDSKKVAA